MSEIKNTAPLIIGEGLDKKRLSRRFLGGNDPLTVNMPPCQFKNELKAYIKGQTHYRYKNNEMGLPAYYKVRQEYFYI